MRRIKLLLLFTVVFGIGVSVGAAVSTQKMMLEDEVYLSPTSGTSLKMLLDSRNLGGGRGRDRRNYLSTGYELGKSPSWLDRGFLRPLGGARARRQWREPSAQTGHARFRAPAG